MNPLLLQTKGSVTQDEKEKCLPTIQQMITLANVARRQGLLALEDKAANDPDITPFLRIGLNLICDGIEGSLVKDITENMIVADALEGLALLKALIQLEGLLCIQAGESPRFMTIKLLAMLGSDFIVRDPHTNMMDAKSLAAYHQALYKSFSHQAGCEESLPFDNKFLRMDDGTIQKIISETDQHDFVYALKLCKYDTLIRFIQNLSLRTANIIMETMKATNDDQQRALEGQKNIMQTADRLYATGA